MGSSKGRRLPGTATVHRCRPGRYEVRASQMNGHVGPIIAVRETRFRADQAADAWYAEQQKKSERKTGT